MSTDFYDFHLIRACLPCGDEDMTPANLVGMAMIKGLQAIALTDHNSSKNCPAAAKHAEGSTDLLSCPEWS